jgi:hypothetical protein
MASYDDTRDVAVELDPESRLFRVTVEMVREMARVSAAAGADFRMIAAVGAWGSGVREAAEIPELGEMARFRARVPDGATLQVPYDPHWNELGHRLYGEALAEALEGSGLLGVPGSENALAADAPGA